MVARNESSEKQRQDELIKNAIKESLYNSISQACIKIVHTPFRLVQLYLIVTILLVASVCSFLVVQSILTYFSYDVTTMTRHLYETPTLFPQVTICNTNIFTTSEAVEFLRQVNREFYPKQSLFDDVSLEKLNFTQRVDLFKRVNTKALFKMNSKNFPDEKRKRLSKNFEDILINCTFNEVEICNETSFKHYFDRDFGK
jgi:hypothetical protein